MIIRIASSLLFLLAASVQADFKYFEEPDPSPYLANIGPLPRCDYVIDTPAKWSNINSSAYRVFCVAPGDYSSVGLIDITTSGTPTEKKWLRYYNPSVPDSKHPYHMAPSERARVDKIRLRNADHWIIDRLYVNNVKSWDNYFSVWLIKSNHNVINGLYIHKLTRGLRFDDGSSYNTAQHTVVHKMTHGSDSVGFHINGRNYDGNHPLAQPKFNRVISNECIDVNDCVHFAGNSPTTAAYQLAGEEDYEGTIVYNNDMYLTPESYTDCNGNYTPTGDCVCKEDGIDIKSGTANSNNPLIVAHNRMWGWRPLDKNDPTCTGPLNSGTSVVSVVVQNNVRNLRYEGNIVLDGGQNFDSRLENIAIKNNFVTQPFTTKNVPRLKVHGLTFIPNVAENVDISGNVITEVNASGYRSFIFQSAAQKSTTVTFANNVLINSNAPLTTEFAGTVSGNRYYNAVKPAWDTQPAAEMASLFGSGWEGKFCTKFKRITTPETKCFANALNTTGAAAAIDVPSALKVVQ